MLRSYLAATAQKAVKQRVQSEKRQQRHKDLMESLYSEAEEIRKRNQANLLAQLDSLQQDLKTAGVDNAQLVHEVESLRDKLDVAQKLAEDMEQQIQHVQSLHELKIQQMEKDTHEQIAQAKQLDQLKTHYEVLKEHVFESELRCQEAVELRRRFDLLKESQENLKHNNEMLREKLLEADARAQEATVVHKRFEALKESSEELRLRNEQLKERLIENENFLRTQEGQVAARFEKQLAEARCECAQARADRDDFEASLDSCKRQLQAARDQNVKLRAYLNDTEAQADKENSDSSNIKVGFISNLLGARRGLQFGRSKQS